MALVTTNVIGYTSTTDNAFTAIRATTYVEQSANAQRSVVSSDANDDGSPGGTGARTIRITYYDQAMAGPFTEDLTLNGTTPVDTVSSTICFIEKMEVLTVGSQLGNVGTIAMKSTTGGGGSNIGSIAPGDNQTQWCHHYVPAGKLAKILDVVGAIKGGEQRGDARAPCHPHRCEHTGNHRGPSDAYPGRLLRALPI